jgi:electron transport complex protein RnfC
MVVMGGPMMGSPLANLEGPVLKGTSGLLAFTEKEVGIPTEHACIRCGRCLEACPMFLNPSQLGILAKNEEYETMADEFHLMDCFECGACTYVCPSHIPLVQYFRMAKKMVRKLSAA